MPVDDVTPLSNLVLSSFSRYLAFSMVSSVPTGVRISSVYAQVFWNIDNRIL